MNAFEVNFDGIVGPSHNYAGLSFGNVASTKHGQQDSNPKAAALQGLAKMRLVHRLGIRQAVLPPLVRPNLDALRALGFDGPIPRIIDQAWKESPPLLAACYSASNMWTANAATVSPSADSDDGKVHLTPANLNNSFHRAIEAEDTTKVLRAIFSADSFIVHEPLPPCLTFSDEGAANHTRLCDRYSDPGLQVFVYGRDAHDKSPGSGPSNFPARQTLQASQTLARLHRLNEPRRIFVRQNPQAIDAGVFHNDVICVGNQNVLLFHEKAFVEQSQTIQEIQRRFESVAQQPLHCIEIAENQLPLGAAVSSYLYNSQLLTRGNEKMTLVCPAECREIEASFQCIESIIAQENPIDQVEFMDLRQSMNNGGGPACLRLRVVLTEAELAAVHPAVLFDDTLYGRLVTWVEAHYRDRLSPSDLRDPDLCGEVAEAMAALADILQLPPDVLGLK